ncbi:MAG: short-chain dehydrogenase, partial [Betaproteobacteria bacterium]|nr:short-chain dehydrogenase [Betaproteobacteria bacterium]
MELNLKGRTALVTGGSRGIGSVSYTHLTLPT